MFTKLPLLTSSTKSPFLATATPVYHHANNVYPSLTKPATPATAKKGTFTILLKHHVLDVKTYANNVHQQHSALSASKAITIVESNVRNVKVERQSAHFHQR